MRTSFVLDKLKLFKDAGEFFRNECRQWELLSAGFYYSWLFYYYPTTVDFDVSYSDNEKRKLVWNFKNDPERKIRYFAHQRALDNILPRLSRLLSAFYGRRNLKELTLLCLPASTQEKNRARFETFSRKLCKATGMENGYEHIHYIKDGMSKNDSDNTTGQSIRPIVSFDEWFEGRFVVLFDDVVTTGETMLYYKKRLQEVDAIVVGGVCLGKTTHTKQTVYVEPTQEEDEEEEETGA